MAYFCRPVKRLFTICDQWLNATFSVTFLIRSVSKSLQWVNPGFQYSQEMSLSWSVLDFVCSTAHIQILGINITHSQMTWFTHCSKHKLNMSFIHAVRNYKLFVNIFSDSTKYFILFAQLILVCLHCSIALWKKLGFFPFNNLLQ